MIMLVGPRTGEPLTWRGRVLLHDGEPAEIWFLLPSIKIMFLKGDPAAVAERLGRPVMMLRDHPDMASVNWPIDRRDFRA
jgi:hypothetical protein